MSIGFYLLGSVCAFVFIGAFLVSLASILSEIARNRQKSSKITKND